MSKKKCKEEKPDKKKDRKQSKFHCKFCGAGASKEKELCKPKKS